MNQPYVPHSNKRQRRREKREALHGPERLIVRSVEGHHRLECGHWVARVDSELPHIQRWRCFVCLAQQVAERGTGDVSMTFEVPSEDEERSS